MKVQGKCLCGSIELTAELANEEVAACHCGMCRRWSGGPFLGVDCGDSVQVSNKELVATYQSSDWAERSFCSKCGTHLYYLLKPANQYHVPVGLFNSHVDYKFTHQIFIDSKPDYYQFANDTTNMTEAEVLAHFGMEE